MPTIQPLDVPTASSNNLPCRRIGWSGRLPALGEASPDDRIDLGRKVRPLGTSEPAQYRNLEEEVR